MLCQVEVSQSSTLFGRGFQKAQLGGEEEWQAGYVIEQATSEGTWAPPHWGQGLPPLGFIDNA